jgi:hypothetical protein
MITPEQRATLQLLLERGQSYADLAALLGQDEADVRARARAALTELVGADPDRNVGLTDYLLGQADPIGRADASRQLRDNPADRQLATELGNRLRLMFPTAELPRLPGEPRQGGGLLRRGPATAPASAEAPDGTGGGASRAGDPNQSQTRLIVIGGSAALLLIVIVLAITGAFGGDDESTAAGTSTTTTAASADEQIQTVALQPIDGGNAQGTAVFGLATGDQAYIDLSIRGLDPAPQDKTYVVWLMLTDTQGYPLSPIAVNQDGTYEDRFAIPAAVLPVVARVRFVDVSIAPVKTIRQLVRDAIKNTALVLDEPGDKVLRGEIPRAQDQAGSQGADGQQGSGGN